MTPINEKAILKQSPPMPATKPQARGKGTNRMRFASRNEPSSIVATPVASAAIAIAAIIVANSVSD